MSNQKKGPSETRRLVSVKGMNGWDVYWWKEGNQIDPESLAWAQVVAMTQRTCDTCDVTLSVTQDRYEQISAGLKDKRGIADAIVDTLTEESRQIVEDRVLRAEVEAIPLSNQPAGPDWIGVEWPVDQAHTVQLVVGDSKGDVRAIRLTRAGPVGEKLARLHVSLPATLLHAVMADTLGRPVSERLYEVIMASYEPEVRPAVDRC